MRLVSGKPSESSCASGWSENSDDEQSAALPPLTGIRVLDLADEPAVFATRILADLGADVIRVERPDGGRLRRLAPFLDDEPGIERSLYHLHHNANKRSVTMDISRPLEADVLKQMASGSDVLVETGAPGEMSSLGLGYPDLKAINPQLVYVSVTPFGQHGPWSGRKGSDLIAAASSGLLFVAGQLNDPPTVAGGDQSYKMASLAAAAGVLIALVGRDSDTDKEGAHLDISVQESASMAALQTSNANLFIRDGNIPQRPGMTRGVFKCADEKWVTLNITADRLRAFLEWVQGSGIEIDMDRELERGGQGPMLDFSARLAACHTRQAFLDKALELDMMSLPVHDFEDLDQCEQLRDTDQFLEVWSDALGRELGFSRSAVDVFSEPMAIRRAPRLGEHTSEVYRELGLPIGDLEKSQMPGARSL